MHLILGAGCAGLSLANALVDAGIDAPITLIDRRAEHTDDRTWCFWADDSTESPIGGIDHAWHRWRVIGRDGTVHEQSSARHPYVQVRGGAFYAAAVARLAAAPNVQVRLGERVRAVEGGAVLTSRGSWAADHVYDAMGGGGPLSAGRPDGAIELRQSFLGLEIETTRAVFDPEVATLMDFRTGPPATGGPADGLHFIYVLPTSPSRALVEHTTLGPSTVSPAVRRLAIAAYLREQLGVRIRAVLREERGVLPMTTHRFALTHGPGVWSVGAAAGAVRPSSGYAFVRIQRHVAAVAAAVAEGKPAPDRVGPAKTELLDRLFLRALAVDPPTFDRALTALAARTGGDTFARFMSDRSTLRDDASVMAALAGPHFLWPMAASSLLRPIARST